MNQETSFLESTGFKVAVFVAGTIVLGALLAPPLFWGGKLLVELGWIKDVPVLDSIHDSMERARFSRYFNRAILAGALIMLFPTLKWLGSQRGTKQSLGERLSALKGVFQRTPFSSKSAEQERQPQPPMPYDAEDFDRYRQRSTSHRCAAIPRYVPRG